MPGTPQAPEQGHRTMRLEITSLTGNIWSGDIREVSLPGGAGRFGIMPRHLPMLSTLREGMAHIVPAQGDPVEVYLSGGHVEVQPGKVLVLADLAVRGENLDDARAEAARACVDASMAARLTDDTYLKVHMELLRQLHDYARSGGRR